jgi:hypothetical protein
MFARQVVLLASVTLLIVPLSVKANDYSPNVVQVLSHVSTCWSLQNLADFADTYVAVYDLSPEDGEQMGVPWVLVQQDVCYKLSFAQSEYIYLFNKPVDEHVAELLSHPQNYAATMQLADVVGEPDNRGYHSFSFVDDPFDIFHGPQRPSMSESPLFFRFSTAHLDGGGWVLLGAQENALDTNISLLHLLPLRYVPKDGFSSDVVWYGNDMFQDSFGTFTESVGALQQGIDDVVRSCDERRSIRLPLQLSTLPVEAKEGVRALDLSEVPILMSGMVYWDLSSGATISRPTSTVAVIEALGCTDAIQSYLKDNKTKVDALDNVLKDRAQQTPSLFVRRSDAEYAELAAYAYYGKSYPLEFEDVSDSLNDTPFVQDIGPVATNTGPVANATSTVAAPTESSVQKNTPDTEVRPLNAPTTAEPPGRKLYTGVEPLSDETVMWLEYLRLFLYFILPIVGLAALWYYHKRSV